MSTLCGASCETCGLCEHCHGCAATNGNPFGKGCLAAEYISTGGCEAFEAYKQQLLSEINGLHIDGMPPVESLFCLPGSYVNLAYPLPDGRAVRFLNNDRVYLGAQVCHYMDDGEGETCFGVVADHGFILVSTYGENGKDPQLICYRQR